MAQRLSKTKVYRFDPVGLDAFAPHAHQPAAGDLVRITQPHGCPRNGTMGFTYVQDAETGEFRGLVLVNSLVSLEVAR